MPRQRSVVTKKSKKQITDCSEHVNLMRTLKGRLVEISLKVDNYIYKQKPIAKLQAKAYLREITSYKSHCQNDIGYLQVIEKLTKYMNIIISDSTTKTLVNDINSDVKVIETPNNSTLTITNENLQTPSDIESESINRDNTQNPTNDQNNLGLTLHNAPTSSTETSKKDKNDSDKQCLKKGEKRNIIKETVDLEKGGVTHISSKVLENGGRVENNNETNLSQTTNVVQSSAGYKDDNKATTNNDKILQIENKVQNSLKNDHRFLICVDGGVIHEIQHLSNATVVHQAPEVHIPLNEFVINNTKTLNTPSNIESKVIQNNIRIKSGKEEENVPEIDKPRGKKTNNKKVKFTAPYIDLTENSRQNNNKSDDGNDKKKFSSNPIPNNSEISIFLKERTKNDTKNTNKNKIKESRPINDKKTKQPAIKKKVNKSNNISNNQDIGTNDNKPQLPAIKRKINKRGTINKNNFPKEIKSNTNDLNPQNDLSWFDSIKYVRKIDEQEYFKPLQPLDTNFWCNPGLILGDDREFTIL